MRLASYSRQKRRVGCIGPDLEVAKCVGAVQSKCACACASRAVRSGIERNPRVEEEWAAPRG
jgi:hypothetical protein